MRKLAFAAAAAVLALSAAPAAATITITTDQQTAQGDNIFFTAGQTGSSLIGSTQSGFQLTFASSEQLLTQANGQSRIAATDGFLNGLTISATDGSAFEFIEFNLFGGTGTGDVTIIGTDQNGLAQPFTFSNLNLSGENFFFASTDELQTIRSISFANANGFTDLRQVRVGLTSMAGAVPEPGTWAMMLLGFAGIGGAVRRARKTGRLLQIA
jgi:opacity protein-like surface antigen